MYRDKIGGEIDNSAVVVGGSGIGLRAATAVAGVAVNLAVVTLDYSICSDLLYQWHNLPKKIPKRKTER